MASVLTRMRHSLGQGVCGRSARDRAGDLESEEAKYNVPAGFVIGQGMAAPTLMTGQLGTTRGICRNSPAAKFGVSCSPNLQVDRISQLCVQAERDGDDWVINGQKIWTSGAHYSDYGILVVRTDPNAKA